MPDVCLNLNLWIRLRFFHIMLYNITRSNFYPRENWQVEFLFYNFSMVLVIHHNFLFYTISEIEFSSLSHLFQNSVKLFFSIYVLQPTGRIYKGQFRKIIRFSLWYEEKNEITGFSGEDSFNNIIDLIPFNCLVLFKTK